MLHRGHYILLLISLHVTGSSAAQEACSRYISRQIGSSIHARQLLVKSTAIQGSDKVVSFKCLSNEFYLNKDVYITCYSGGQWNDTLPKCLRRCPEIVPRKLTNGGQHINATNNIVRSTDDRRQNTTVYLSCATDGYEPETTPYLTCLPNSSWDRAVPLCKSVPPKPLPLETKLTMIYGSLAGLLFFLIIINIIVVIIYRRRNSKKAVPEVFEGQYQAPERFYKVWCSHRNTRKVLKAKSLEDLKQNAALAFKYTDTVRIVLEEDGTELETDEGLLVYTDKILMVLSAEETWRKVTDDNGDRDVDGSKFTFDVCSFDRKLRKLILAEGLADLKRQGSVCFGYPVSVACLESDGTVIDEDVKLLAYANQVFMLLGLTQIWAPNYSAFNTDKDSMCGTNRKMFKIKTMEGKDKIAIVANNVVELHLLAARILKLNPPIQVHTEEGTTVVSDSDLEANQGRLLIVSEVDNSGALDNKKRQSNEQSPRQHVNSYQPGLSSNRQSVNLYRHSLASYSSNGMLSGTYQRSYDSNQRMLSGAHQRSYDSHHRYCNEESEM